VGPVFNRSLKNFQKQKDTCPIGNRAARPIFLLLLPKALSLIAKSGGSSWTRVYFGSKKMVVHSLVVMDDHVHMLLTPLMINEENRRLQPGATPVWEVAFWRQ